MSKFIENKLIETFKDVETFSREELFSFFLKYEPDLKESTFGWRIYDLKKRNIIKNIKLSLYSISSKLKYKPLISDRVIKIAKKANEKLEGIKYSIMDTQWLNEFSRHQTTSQMIFIEVERDFVETLYYHFKDTLNADIYFNPDHKDINFYINESVMPIVIKRLNTRSPLSKIGDKKFSFYVPTLEKMMVDLFVDDRLFHFYQGSEIVTIYKQIIEKYNINFTTLFSYAKRRKKELEIKQFMTKNMSELLNQIKDD